MQTGSDTNRQLIRGEHLQPGQVIQFRLMGQWQAVTLRSPLLPGSAGYGRQCWQICGHMLPITIERDCAYAVVPTVSDEVQS